MDSAKEIEAKARIKANSRLTPAKDIHVAFSQLLSSADPERFEELKAKLLLAIDSAAEEYQILAREVDVISSLTDQWKEETKHCQADMDALQAELVRIDEESEVIARKISTQRQLEKMKEQLIQADLPMLRERIAETERSNEELAKEIESTKATNERRSVGFDEVLSGFRKFLLLEPTGNTDDVE